MKDDATASAITVAIVEDDAEIREMLGRVVRRSPQLNLLGSFASGLPYR